MGSYKEIEGNLLDMFDEGKFDAIIQGCNCKNVMGAGIAGQIRKRFPEAFYADKHFLLPDTQRLGCYSIAKIDHGVGHKLIINLYSQYYPGPDADPQAITIGLRKIAIAYTGILSTIGLPLIGCGIGGLSWDTVGLIVQRELKNFNVTVVHFKP